MIFNQRSVSHLLHGLRRWGQNSTFSKPDHVAYQIKENHECSNMVAPPPPPPSPPPHPLGMWSIGQIQFFPEHGHVAYQIKENHKCSNMVANILPADHPHPWGWGQKVKIQLFQNMVMLHIKLKGIMKWQQHGSKYFARRHPPPTLGMGSIGQKSIF